MIESLMWLKAFEKGATILNDTEDSEILLSLEWGCLEQNSLDKEVQIESRSIQI